MQMQDFPYNANDPLFFLFYKFYYSISDSFKLMQFLFYVIEFVI
jgi:hypothetical protein